MMVMWAKHSGDDDPDGGRVIDYFCDAFVPKPLGDGGRERIERIPPPEILRGDPQLMRWAIQAVPFQRKYASVVLSFERNDVDVGAFNAGDPTLRKLVFDIIQGFEDAAFAGVPVEHRPPTLWTTHTHTGRLELNACMPRALLGGSGLLRSINPHPPGPESRKLWDAFRDVLNCRHAWADPEDPARAQLVSTPNWVAKITAEAQRAGKEDRKHVTQLVHDYVVEAVALGIVRCRDDLIAQLRGQGIGISRIGRDYITLVNDAGIRIRLRGLAFSETFTSPAALPANRPPKDRLNLPECEARLQGLLAGRATFNISRYGGPKWHQADEPRDIAMSLCRILGVSTPETQKKGLDLGEAELSVVSPRRPRQGNYKAMLFLALFGNTLTDDLVLALSWVDRARRAIWLNDGACIIDHGEKITSTKTSRLAVRLMVAEAHAKGWQCITLTGSDAFKQLASEEAAKLGIAVSNPEARNMYSLIWKPRQIDDGHSDDDGARIAGRGAADGGRTEGAGCTVGAKTRELDAASERLGRSVRDLAESSGRGVTRIRHKRELAMLEALKVDLDLRAVAATLGFVVDRRACDQNHTVMRHTDGTKLIVGVAASGHWVFSSNMARQGTVIDLLHWREELSVGEAIQRLRSMKPSMEDVASFGERPQPQPQAGNALLAKTTWECANRLGRSAYLEQERGLMEETLTCPRFVGTFRVDARNNAVFPYTTKSGVVGVEQRNRPVKEGGTSFKVYTKGGLPGLWRSRRGGQDCRLVFVESPIDAMSHYEMSPPELQQVTRYVAIRSGCPAEEVTATMREMPEGAEIVSACDRDRAGEAYTDQLRKLAGQLGRPLSVEVSEAPAKDWNEALQASKASWWRRLTTTRRRP